jgi:type II secretory pathway pseudopilin PulG
MTIWTLPDCKEPPAEVVVVAVVVVVVPEPDPPENAWICAMPLTLPAWKRTLADPLCVRASYGSKLPRLVLKVTSVPFCTGVPDDSITVAVTSVEPFTGSTVCEAYTEIVEPDGASSGTLSQEPTRAPSASVTSATTAGRTVLDWSIMVTGKDNSFMHLEGQAARASDGYAMAGLLIALSVMSVMLTVAMPVWHQANQREKEEEYLFRAKQYARAIQLFQRKRANAFPNTIDELLGSNNERYLRKKYKDPLTGEDFELVRQGSQAAAVPGMPGLPTPRISTPGASAQPKPSQASGGGGIVGVVSKSKGTSVKQYKGRTKYNEWQVLYSDVQLVLPGQQPTQPGQQPGRPGQPGRGGPGQPGQPGQPTRPGAPTPSPGGQPPTTPFPQPTRPPG